MKVAILGSRNLLIHVLEEFLPSDFSEIVLGDYIEINSCVKLYAYANNIPLK